jgi:alpha-1,3-rhamnosyl/mannosyltransferase
LAAVAYGHLQSLRFRWLARGLTDDLLHSPNYILPPWPGPAVATLHDLSHLHYPDYHPPERIAYLEACLPRTLRCASRLLCDSEYIRQEIITLLGVPAERIHAIPLGADPAFHPRPVAEIQPTLDRYRLADLPYLLIVATLEPRKNLTRTVAAYARLPAALRERHPLVLAGAVGWLSESLERQFAPLERSGQLRRLGYVPQTDLPLLYTGAWAFAYLSLYEGFGLPVLEALRSGVPVLTANRSSLPEVAGDAAILVDPEDVDAITAGLERALTDASWRASAIEQGLQQSRQFSWERCVEETLAVYRDALGG